MKFWVPYNARNVLTSRVTVNFLGGTLLSRVSQSVSYTLCQLHSLSVTQSVSLSVGNKCLD